MIGELKKIVVQALTVLIAASIIYNAVMQAAFYFVQGFWYYALSAIVMICGIILAGHWISSAFKKDDK